MVSLHLLDSFLQARMNTPTARAIIDPARVFFFLVFFVIGINSDFFISKLCLCNAIYTTRYLASMPGLKILIVFYTYRN